MSVLNDFLLFIAIELLIILLFKNISVAMSKITACQGHFALIYLIK